MENIDISQIAKQYGKLTVISIERKKSRWWCTVECQCGTVKQIDSYFLRKGKATSCGCEHIDKARRLASEGIFTGNIKHGILISGSEKAKTYYVWNGLKNRCLNKNTKNYRHYGGRGIEVCDEWKNSFANFYRDMGDKPDGMSLDRLDTNKGYSKENCKWSTVHEQLDNRRITVKINYEGVPTVLREIAKKEGISAKQFRVYYYRYKDMELVLQKVRSYVSRKQANNPYHRATSNQFKSKQ